jgi:2-heptyl-3-hydroxy-4(1H)-quinolone synthase
MKILVVGAGLAGLAFVRALQCVSREKQFDCSIEVVERAPAFKDGNGIVLHPNGLSVIEALGLSKDILSFSNVIDCIEISKKSNKVTIHLEDVWGAGNLSRTIQRKNLHELFVKKLATTNNTSVNLRMGCQVNEISQNENGVIAYFENGEIRNFDLLVAADGVHSPIRRSLFPHAWAQTTDLLYFRFVAHNTIGLSKNSWKTFERSEGAYGFIHLDENLVHCFVQLKTHEFPFESGDEELYFLKSLMPWDELLSAAWTARVSKLHVGFAYMVRPKNWSKGRCVLLGDAAHAVAPTLSQGGSLAMEDALILALSICSSESIETAISSYQEARYERCMWAFRMALAQLNSMRVQRKSVMMEQDFEKIISTKVMAEIYKPFREFAAKNFNAYFNTTAK